MKIETLHLNAFKSYLGIEIPTDAPRVLLSGINGVGKSAIRDAIRWTLTGRCSVTDGKGAGADRLIPTGQKQVSSSVNLSGLGLVSRIAGNGSSAFTVSGFTGEKQTQQTAIHAQVFTRPPPNGCPRPW